MQRGITLSAVLIVRNEAPIIADCLARLAGFDEIVVVDTGSTDDTAALAQAAGARVFTDFAWCDDFAAARNHAIGKASGDWCLSVDADHFLDCTVEVVREAALAAERAGAMTALAQAVYPTGQHHWFGVLFRRDPAVRWVGRVHEVLMPAATIRTPIRLRIGESPAKAADPDRNLRILRTGDRTDSRTLFYLAKELYERGAFAEAIAEFEAYLRIATWLPEICDARLLLARCHWATGNGDAARANCLEALRNNPDFKEALLFMAVIHFEPWKHKWLRLAAAATNEDVLFVRAP